MENNRYTISFPPHGYVIIYIPKQSVYSSHRKLRENWQRGSPYIY